MGKAIRMAEADAQRHQAKLGRQLAREEAAETGLPRRKKLSRGEELLWLQINTLKLEGWAREVKFAPDRRWRFDFAHEAAKVAVEVEGGIWTEGRHTRGSGFVEDMAKYNRAALLGWRVLRFSTEQVQKGEAIRAIQAMEEGADAQVL